MVDGAITLPVSINKYDTARQHGNQHKKARKKYKLVPQQKSKLQKSAEKFSFRGFSNSLLKWNESYQEWQISIYDKGSIDFLSQFMKVKCDSWT